MSFSLYLVIFLCYIISKSNLIISSRAGPDNIPVGMMGNVELLNSKVISSQPIVSMDWSPDKEGLAVLSCLDQTIRCYIVTKLNKY